jgi:Na+/H+-dicarboxylate symporter
VDLRFPAKQAEHLPLYAKSLLHASDVTLKPLPEIAHVMRPPAKRASNFMATLFTGLTVAPLVVFIVFLLHMRPDLQRLGSLANLAALGCLALMLVLYVSYWLSLKGVSFYETIKYLSILTPVTVVVGSYSLASVKAMRIKQAEAAVKDKQN